MAKRKPASAKPSKLGRVSAKKGEGLVSKGRELVHDVRGAAAKAKEALGGLRDIVATEIDDGKLSGFVAAMAKRSVAAVRAGLAQPPSLKVDPRLRFLVELVVEAAKSRLHLASVASESGLAESFAPHEQEVLVRGQGDGLKRDLERAGMTVWSVTPGVESVASGVCSLAALPAIAELSQVRQVEAARPMVSDLDRSRLDIRAEQLHSPSRPGTAKVRGKGTIVGIIDSGIDYTHADFRTAQGKSRILFLWDQAAVASGGSVPFGREYTRAEINAALASANPFTKVPHRDDAIGHGTHVASIAAGNGLSKAAFCGIAPEADLIVVAYGGENANVTLGKSVRAAEAVSYLVRKADGRPIVINMSQGMNGGGHCGETLLETRMDLLAREPNVVIVKSAGNEQLQRIHAGGTLEAGQTLPLGLVVENNDQRSNVVEIWWGATDRISVALQPPEGAPLAFVSPGQGQAFITHAGNRIRIDVDANADGTGDHRAVISIAQGSGAFIQPGTWKLLLRGDAITSGRYDAWIERDLRIHGEQMRFPSVSADNTRTITIPGTARRVITVGSYVTRANSLGDVEGAISTFSCRGPTRYNLQKPEIVAPGQWIIAARNANSMQPAASDAAHTMMQGTSMAAPHVAGVAALVLSQKPGLTCEQVKQILMRSARRSGAAQTAPDNTWGNGMLDAVSAVALAKEVKFPKISQVKVTGTVVRVKTSGPTTAAVRYHTHRRQLELGRAGGSRVVLAPAKTHAIDLAGLTPGEYLCEVNVFDAANWQTTDDREGEFYTVTVP